MEFKPTVAFHTLGCKLNFSETSTIARRFETDGYTRVSFQEKADVYVINTCSVTENADKECKKIVKDALRANADAFVCVVGCYAQLKPNEIAKIDGVDLVLGATEKFKLTSYINNFTKKIKTEIHSCEIEDANVFVDAYSIGDRTRAFLKVQDGCDYTCSYCTIPLARGISRSDSMENVIANAKNLWPSGRRAHSSPAKRHQLEIANHSRKTNKDPPKSGFAPRPIRLTRHHRLSSPGPSETSESALAFCEHQRSLWSNDYRGNRARCFQGV